MLSRFLKRPLLHVVVWAISLSYAFSDWDTYKASLFGHPDAWKLRLHGGIDAPLQYREGVWVIVDWMQRLTHIKTYDALTLVDLGCLVLSLYLLVHVLSSFEIYQASARVYRQLAIVSLFLGASYYLAWGHWFQESSTLPSVLFVCLTLALVQGKLVHNRHLATLLLLGLSYLQGFIRADVAVVLHAGFFLFLVFSEGRKLTKSKLWHAAISLLAALIAGCVQLYLMIIRFPNARYGSDGVVRLAWNIHPFQWMTMLLALLPYWLLLRFIFGRYDHLERETKMLLVASGLYLAVWSTVGLLGEVHIFLPFGMALLPATCMAYICRLQHPSVGLIAGNESNATR